MPSINTVKSRDTLKPRHSAYWQLIRRGCYLGFRKLTSTSTGTWYVRYRDDDGKQKQHSLGEFEDVAANERYDCAKNAAEEWFKHLSQGGSSKGETVADACKDYADSLAPQAKKDAEGRFKRWVYNHKIAKIELVKLRHSDVKAWRTALESTPKIPQNKASLEIPKPRSASSINRDMNTFRAALNLAITNRLISEDSAWKIALRPIANAENRRNVYLDAVQRKLLIDHAQTDLQPFLRALCYLPLRPGAVAALTVSDYQSQTSVLTIGKDKAGQSRRIKLPANTSEFFKAATKDKTPAAYLFLRRDGKPWDKDSWKYPLKDAVRAAQLPETTTAYALRHSTITDLLSLHGLDTLSVAALAGTSLAMIEKHYGHLIQDHAAIALGKLAL
jgi:integrase